MSFISTTAVFFLYKLPWTSVLQNVENSEPVFILILSSHLCLGHPSSRFTSCFPVKTSYALFSPPNHRIFVDFTLLTILGQRGQFLIYDCEF